MMRHSDERHLSKLVFIHIPKTAGLSLHHELERHFGESASIRFGDYEEYVGFAKDFGEDLAKYDYITGHFSLREIRDAGIDYPAVAVVRDPLERLVSLLRYYRTSTLPNHQDLKFGSIESFIAHLTRTKQFDMQCWHFAGTVMPRFEDAVEAIRRDHVFVAPLEFYDDFLKTLSELLGTHLENVRINVTPKSAPIIITDAERQFFQPFIGEGRKLVAYVRENYDLLKREFIEKVTCHSCGAVSKSAGETETAAMSAGDTRESLATVFEGRTLLFVDYAVPQYDKFAGSRTNFMYLSLLVKMGLTVKFLPADFKHVEPYSTELEGLGVEVLAGDWYRDNWRQWMRDNGKEIDYVFFHKPDPALKFLDAVRKWTKAAIIYQCHDLHYLRLRRKAELKNDQRILAEANCYERKENVIFSNSDVLLTFSDVEERIIKDKYPQKQVLTVPLFFYDSVPTPDRYFGGRRGLLFVGGFGHAPNQDAVLWFCKEVFPLIMRQIPDIVFHVAGSNPPDEIVALASENVKILGNVSDEKLGELYDSVRLVVVPLRFGAGVKGKTVEAMYHGVPVVSASIGLEGIKGIDQVLTPQDDPGRFAEEVVTLYLNEKRLEDLSKRSSRFIESTFSMKKTETLLGNILSCSEKEAAARIAVSAGAEARQETLRAIAFYLPQYHPIPENDEWWGKGFTEWRNVSKAKPLFPGHYQPHIPADLGFYDLRLEETRIAQAELARTYGIYGFCYYHYWFNGKRLLDRPLEDMLKSGKPDFPFCICWANENWTRRWDGEDQHVLMKVEYSEEDDRHHIRELFRIFEDPRYIRINGKPLFLVYRTENIPDPARTAEVWREEARKAGMGELYLCRVESIGRCDPRVINFDAALEFAPDWHNKGPRVPTTDDARNERLEKFGIINDVYEKNYVHQYGELVNNMMKKPIPDYTWFRCVTPSWDNSARRREGAHIFLNSSPEKYGHWLESAAEQTNAMQVDEERIVFINAWNEWAEGNHLEPDQFYGRDYLDATREALDISTLDQRAGKHKEQVKELRELKKLVDGYECHIDQIGNLFVEREGVMAEYEGRLAIQERVAAEQARQIQELQNSLSWRVTRPLRKVYELLGLGPANHNDRKDENR